MHQLFLSGKISFQVNGAKEHISEVMSDVDNGLASLNIIYHEDNIDKMFEIRLSGILEGIFEFKKISPTSIFVNLDGVVRTYVKLSTINAIIKNSLPWRIKTISSCYRSIQVPNNIQQHNIELTITK